jgi:hypothetical protein
MNKDTSNAKFIFFAKFFRFAPRWVLIELSASFSGRIKSFPLSISFRHGSPCSYITWGINDRHVGGRSSEM